MVEIGQGYRDGVTNLGIAGWTFQRHAQTGDRSEKSLLLCAGVQLNLDGFASDRNAIELDHHTPKRQLLGGLAFLIDRPRGQHQIGIDRGIGKVRGRRQVVDHVLGVGCEVHTDPSRWKWRVAADGNFVLHQRRRHTQCGAWLRGSVQRADVTSGVDHVLEDRLAAVTDRDIQRTGDLQLPLSFVTLIAIAAVRGPHEWLCLALKARKEVLAASVARVHQGQQFIFALAQFGSDGFPILGAQTTVARLYGKLTYTLQHGIDRVESDFFLGQAVLRRGQVGVVLTKHILLLVQLQQAHRRYRVICWCQDAVAGTDLFLGTGRVGVVALQSGDAVIECLQGGNAHGAAYYLKVLISVSNRERAT